MRLRARVGRSPEGKAGRGGAGGGNGETRTAPRFFPEGRRASRIGSGRAATRVVALVLTLAAAPLGAQTTSSTNGSQAIADHGKERAKVEQASA